MKKIFLISIFIAVLSLFSHAQKNKIYVERQGGEKKLLYLGAFAYNYFHFTNESENCDTLICSGSGFEKAKISKRMCQDLYLNTKRYKLYNKAIKKTAKHIRKTKTNSGELELRCNNRKIMVNYYDANEVGEAKMEIQLF